MIIAEKIRVLLIEDSSPLGGVIASGISQDPSIEVAGIASDAYEARDKIMQLSPDVLVMNMEIRGTNGIDFLRRLIPQYPLPAVVISSVQSKVFDALSAGAIDFVNEPETASATGLHNFFAELAARIKTASVARVGRFKKDYCYDNFIPGANKHREDAVIAIGASTGGTEAISQLAAAFPRGMNGIVVVQHMPPLFTGLFAERLNKICRMEVKEAEDRDRVYAGRILIAPGGSHMILEKGGEGYFVRYRGSEKVSGHCPSVDVLFDSVADSAGCNAVGVILTGMGSDGARGLLKMRNHGASTIGQDEKTSVIYGMPMAAYNAGAVMKQAPLEKIPEAISSFLTKSEVINRYKPVYSLKSTGRRTFPQPEQA